MTDKKIDELGDILDNMETDSHPMEDALGIESNSTLVPETRMTVVQPSDIEYDTNTESFDEKDEEVEKQIDAVYYSALETYEQLMMDTDKIDPRYKSRTAEVGAQFLKTALDATKEKRMLKTERDKNQLDNKKLETQQNQGGVTNNNLIVADRNEILKMINKPSEGE